MTVVISALQMNRSPGAEVTCRRGRLLGGGLDSHPGVPD